MDYAFLTIFPGEIKLGSLLDFDHVWVGEDLYQIWCFIQNLHYGFVYTPHYFLIFGLNTEIYSVNLRIQTKYRKIQTRYNSLFGHFSRSDVSYATFTVTTALHIYRITYWRNLNSNGYKTNIVLIPLSLFNTFFCSAY